MVIPHCTLSRFAWLLIVLNLSSCIYFITRDTYTNQESYRLGMVMYRWSFLSFLLLSLAFASPPSFLIHSFNASISPAISVLASSQPIRCCSSANTIAPTSCCSLSP